MGVGDRPYYRSDFRMPGGMGGMQEVMRRMMGLGPAPGPKPWAVKWLVIANIIVFFAQVFLDKETVHFPRGMLTTFFAISLEQWAQVWRYGTFQFLHAGFGHIFWNMLALFMLGRMLEREMGSKRFLIFYLTCGVVAGLAYVVMAAILGSGQIDPTTPLIGASGGVYAVLFACAVRFPNMKLLLAFIFPVAIRVAVAIAFGVILFVMLQALSTGGTSNAFWSQVAHLGGVIGACIWIWGLPKLMTSGASVGAKVQQGAWDRKMKKREEADKTVDEVLRKIHDKGINSLTEKEKNILADATARQRDER
jgi:membrane associated rhomboid family serine protease